MRRSHQRTIGLIAIAVLAGAPSALAEEKDPGLLFAHRGGAHEFEENTLSAFKASYEKGLRGFETDVRMTRDGRFVLVHDESLERTHGASGGVEEKTAHELANVKTRKQGEPLVFLDELLDYFADKPGVYLELEMKTGNQETYPDARLEEYCRGLLKAIEARRPDGSTYVVTSFDKRPLKIVKRLEPEADVLFIVNNGKCGEAEIREAEELGAKRIGVRIDRVTRSDVEAAQKAGLRVSCWPGHSLRDYHLAVGLGVDAICCDVPVAVQRWKDEHEK
jgi:glycerophosphoryl diester phosphodiesterase